MDTRSTYRISPRYHFVLTVLPCIKSVNESHTLKSCFSTYLIGVDTVVLIFIKNVGCIQDTVGYIKIQHVYIINQQLSIYILNI